MDHLNLVGGAYTDSTKYQGLLCTALLEESMACVTYPRFVSCDTSHVFGLFASLMSRCDVGLKLGEEPKIKSYI